MNPLKVTFTDTATQISARDWDVALSEHCRVTGEEAIPSHLYRVEQRIARFRHPLYDGLRPSQGSQFLHYRIGDRLTVNLGNPKDATVELLITMSDYFLGAPLGKVTRRTEDFTGLPFWSLLASVGGMLPPHRVPEVLADFDNVETDSTDIDYLAFATEMFPDLSLKLAYQQLRSWLYSANSTGGTCFIKPE